MNPKKPVEPKPAPALVPSGHHYSEEAVDAAIASSNRAGRKIGAKEAKLIHRLLKGRH
jgi:hypothetical protein